MNALNPRPGRQTIEIIFDFVCPWCHLGVARLLDALQSRPMLSFDLIWRPFLLDPDMPPEGMTRQDYALRKYGGDVRAKRLYAAVTRIGLEDGVPFRFDRMTRVPSTVNAHRLVRWASERGDATGLVSRLMRAHFADGADLGDPRTLAMLAAETGFDPAAAARMLASLDHTDSVYADNLNTHRAGIAGVPCVVIDGDLAVAGVQDVKVFQRLLDVAALERVVG
ncbi:DsbA family oxidoreductase [Acetobacteraceae bacterium KSS8]|uniref:DsbA family oxidoreductase n=1 Tax=Endosaccharibacter trunci TaxID=2812733 RepID=A0ABT1W7G0_9PROT|nr:DsbA family oxidoreductase [Acetobacteraceae bacterium KSS8]